MVILASPVYNQAMTSLLKKFSIIIPSFGTGPKCSA